MKKNKSQKVNPLSYQRTLASYQEARNERSEWEAEARLISDYLLPGRGIYQTYSKPRKRQLTTKKIVNTAGEDALYVLTSGMHGGLTSPSMEWFKHEWVQPELNEFEPLKQWLQECHHRLNASLHASNFYSVINSFYIEYAGFGTGDVYVGEDSGTDQTPFRFELLTFGEYAFSTSATGRPDTHYRTIIRSPKQVVEMFPNASDELKLLVKNNDSRAMVQNVVLIEMITRLSGQKKFTRVVYQMSGQVNNQSLPSGSDTNQLLKKDSFYELPYMVARWGTIGSDEYGIGPGSRALPHIRRLQEMEKAFLMATHKAIDPPVNAPARMMGKLNRLPGGTNYYSNPNEVVTPLENVRFDFQGVSAAIERVEQRIQRNFFNDIFLTAARDPNASPLKATQVNVQEQEKMLRLGPVIERLQHEFLQPMLERCFNIMLRKGLFPALPPELQQMAGDYKIVMVSPLATAQRGIAMNGINTFMGFLGQAAQFDPTIMDNIDADAAARKIADISGVDLGILRPDEEVKARRQQRAQAEAKQRQAEAQVQGAGMQSQVGLQDAQARKTAAEAGQIQLETQQTAQEIGMM